MKIKKKLIFFNTILTGTAVLIIFVVIAGFRIQINYNKKHEELKTLNSIWTTIEKDMYHLTFDWNKGIAYENIKKNIESFNEKVSLLNSKNRYLIFSGKEISEIDNNITNLWEYVHNVQLIPVLKNIESILQNSVSTELVDSENINFTEIYYKELYKNKYQNYELYRMLEDIMVISLSTESFTDVLELSVYFIDDLVLEVNKAAGYLTFIISVLLLLGALVFSLSFSDKIAANIKIIEKSMRNVAEGDFTRRPLVDSKDEIGDLSNNFNLTIEKISSLVNTIKKEANSLKDVGDDLASNMSETATAITQISSNIRSVKSQTLTQSDGCLL